MIQSYKNFRQIQELIEEVIQTFRQLRVISAEIHGSGLPIPGQRGVLMQLNHGVQTVPGMARERGVSRQSIQKIVDGFVARGLVELVDNAAHRRSKLVRLTAKGKTAWKEMVAREVATVKKLRLQISPAEVEKTISVLHLFRRQLKDNWPTR